ncbi:hypothetical protein Tco_1555356 [Tanacetum coccineum]
MILWGDLQVLFESHEGGTGAGVWVDQQQWVIRSWRLFPFSGVHVLEAISGKILYMFADTPYPLSAQLVKKMLKHKLEVEIDGTGNDMTYAEQLIQFIKNQAIRLESIESSMDLTLSGPRLDADFLVADSKFMKVAFGVGFKMIVVPSSGIVTTSRYVVPTGRVKVPAGRYVVPTGKDNVIVSAGRTKVIPAGSTILVLRVLRKQVVRVSCVFKKPTALDEVGDVYLTAEELHQLHLDEEALRETLEEQTMDEKAREEKIRQKQAEDDEYFMEFEVKRIDLDYESSD